MTDAGRGEDATAATSRYERLRRDVLAATRSSGLGLVVLMREGVAAWLVQAATPSMTITSITEPIAVPPTVPGDVQADVISVLANMAMAISQEMHP